MAGQQRSRQLASIAEAGLGGKLKKGRYIASANHSYQDVLGGLNTCLQ